MARGQGRGRGSGMGKAKQIPIVTFGSTVGVQGSNRTPSTLVTPVHMPGVMHSGTMSNSLEQETKQPDLEEAVVESPYNIISSPRSTQGIVATVANGTVPESPRTEVEDEYIEDPPIPQWSNLFTKNIAATNGLSLEYIPPKVVKGQQIIELAQEEINKELHKWTYSLIAYFIGHTPGYKAMQRYVTQFWSNVAQPDIYLHEVGYYIIRFQTKENMQEILYNGPYTINNKPIILKRWSIDFDLSKEFPTEIPLWVKFPDLPMTCWSKDSLSRIGSAVGKHVYDDVCTTDQNLLCTNVVRG
ncbi:hypothetical protein R3W88_004791 [Solanum pinnatisectum]|uniref:DUF4283 domain-containing protein n=1 Tax=Solanum pinnatisectum TaxID=50273 RepID=A0AAV9KBP1_9SOLN|nr:hypothetical protein R3W88_004791 [Solanum pinnatisectum]